MARRRSDGERVDPTPQTVAKLRLDPVRQLWLDFKIDEGGLEALVEIRRAFNWITRPVALRLGSFEGIAIKRKAPPSDNRNDPPYVRRYLAWIDAMSAAGKPVGPIFDLVLEGVDVADDVVTSALRLWRWR